MSDDTVTPAEAGYWLGTILGLILGMTGGDADERA